MLELQNISYMVDDDNKEILRDINLAFDEKFVAITGSLSGGELKRIEIAMIKARATKLSVFDEPEAGIDLWSFNSLIHVFEDLHEKTDGTILIISHQERILEIADRIIVINDGLVEKSGKGEEVIPELLYKSSMCQKLNRD